MIDTATSPARIEARGLEVIRSSRAILSVGSLEVRPSEILAVVGPNGAGKTTLLLVLGLLLRPDRGSVRLGGVEITRREEQRARRRLACVFQSPLLLDRSVRANVELGLRLRGASAAESNERSERWLETLGLSCLADRRARYLSGGEAQRVNLARALALAPEVLLLDEPLGGLDAPTRQSLMDELGPLVRRGAGSALLVTHDRAEALALGDRIAVMLGGRIRQVGTPDEVFSRPVDEEVARFVGVENILPGAADGAEVRIGDGLSLRSAPGPDGEVILCLRAEEVRFGPAFGGEDWNRLEGRVTRILPRGDGYLVEVDVGRPLVGCAARSDVEVLGLEAASRVTVSIRPEAVHRITRDSRGETGGPGITRRR